MITREITAETYEATNEEYHADHSRISNSMRKVFVDSRREYEGQFITNTLPPRNRTAALDDGYIGHAAILEPHIIESACAAIPREVLNKDGHRKGKAWTDFEEANPGKILRTKQQIEKILSWRLAVEANPATRKWLDMKGPVEQSIRWQDPATGLWLRCRPDKRTARCIVDVKTCRDSRPIEFSKDCANFRYAEQAAFYREGVMQLTGEVLPVLFIAVSKEPPYVARAYELDAAAMQFAEECVRKSLEDLAYCYGADDWREPGEEEVMELSLPNWAFFRNQWEV